MKVLLADDHDLVRDALKAYLESEKDIVVITVPDLNSACEAASKSLFDVVLLDYAMPGMNGLEGMSKAMEAGDGRPVAIMSGTASKSVAQSALAAGAAGFLPKTMGAKSLVNAVRFIAAGETYVPVDFMNSSDAERKHPIAADLSSRELEVLERLCLGLANKEIARELDLQEVTIKLHVKTLCRKLHAKNRTQAALIAKDAGLF
ncbi:response regulator transcription factor [Ruegeria sp. WL0004]|uniref:Response regulator transcription factor n=1 Tax=Ruegeria marisflavi TaxID=2984152 RepID=A0ABT2WU49_9RHOB|nr:response regulator transcription factor [Ruegeria sp. WL0004]MCU9839430.1 response regulator transcription factor [Ruegeria sp. WL0004]